MSTARIIAAVRTIRADLASSEYDIHAEVARALRAAGVAFRTEVKLGPRARIDFLAEGGTGIEIKKGKVASAALRAQATRYCAFPVVLELVLLVERCVFAAPLDLGKPVHYLSLSKNWGISI